MIQKILVPLDGSELAEQALPYAEALAQKFEAELILLWVLQLPSLVVMPDIGGAHYVPREEVDDTPAYDYLGALQDKFSKQKLATRIEVIKSSFVADAIIDLASQEEVDVIVKTTHGRSGIRRWLFGNVATKVLQQAPCPVFLVRVRQRE